MRRILLSLLLLVGCASTPKPEPATPVSPPLMTAPMPSVTPPRVDPDVVESTTALLMFMVSHLDMGLAESMELCDALGGELKPIEDKVQWFNCGGSEGYNVAVNDEAVVMYVAIADAEGWTVPVMRSILGPEDNVDHGEELVEVHWVKQDMMGTGPDLDISLNLPKDGRPFVGVKYRPSSKSGALSL